MHTFTSSYIVKRVELDLVVIIFPFTSSHIEILTHKPKFSLNKKKENSNQTKIQTKHTISNLQQTEMIFSNTTKQNNI